MSKFILFSRLNRRKPEGAVKERHFRHWLWQQQKVIIILAFIFLACSLKEIYNLPTTTTKHTQQKVLNILVIVLIAGAGFGYLVAVNQTASTGFELTALEERVAEQRQANQKLELEKAELSAMPEIQRASEELRLVAVDKVDYLQDSAVALGE